MRQANWIQINFSKFYQICPQIYDCHRNLSMSYFFNFGYLRLASQFWHIRLTPSRIRLSIQMYLLILSFDLAQTQSLNYCLCQHNFLYFSKFVLQLFWRQDDKMNKLADIDIFTQIGKISVKSLNFSDENTYIGFYSSIWHQIYTSVAFSILLLLIQQHINSQRIYFVEYFLNYSIQKNILHKQRKSDDFLFFILSSFYVLAFLQIQIKYKIYPSYFTMLHVVSHLYYTYYNFMNFFSKGDFKIQESWNADKSKDPKSNKSRNGPRNSSLNTNNNQSLMRQLADSLAQPSTDVIDDSLSKLLMRQRQNYGGIPKSKKEVQDANIHKRTPTIQQARKVQSNNDSDLVSSMANRLQKLEKTCQSQRQQIKQQKDTIQKIKTENAFLKGMKEDSSKAYDEMKQLKSKNQQLQKKVSEMEAYLKQYGLKWVGNKIDGKLNDKAIKKQISESKYAYRLPSQIDIGTIKRRVAQLNAGIQAEGLGTQIYSDKGVHKFRKAETLPMGFYSNGLVVKGYNFYPYKSKQSLKILADLIDGYFPYIFKAKYPNGVLLEVIDHIQQAYVQQKKQEKTIGTIGGSDKDFQPMSKEQFLNKLPKQVIKDGKVISVRGQIQKLFHGSEQNKKVLDQNSYLVEVQGVLQLKTSCWQAINNCNHSADQSCFLKVRLENGTIYMMKMFKNDKVIDIIVQLRKVLKNKFNLATNFPKRIYNGEQKQSLQQLGFFPNENLHILPVK